VARLHPGNRPQVQRGRFLYGRYLHEVLGVPVGLIDNSWGGSAAEAWIRRTTIDADPRFQTHLGFMRQREADIASGKAKTEHDAAMAKWKLAADKAKAEGKTPPAAPQSPRHGSTATPAPAIFSPAWSTPRSAMVSRASSGIRANPTPPAPTITPSSSRFSLSNGARNGAKATSRSTGSSSPITWRRNPPPARALGPNSAKPKPKTQRLPNTGQAVIIDLGEGQDIHPRNKHDVAARLVRWALAKDYGMKIRYRSPEYQSMTVAGGKVTVTLDCFGSKLRAFDVAEARGFAICGEDKVWHSATGKVVASNKVEVSHPEVPAPIAVRYAWADNPVCNLFSDDGLPVTPFRTDDFEMTTKPKPPAPKI